MSCADGGGEGSAQAADPSPRGPLAGEHKRPLTFEVGLTRHPTVSRGPDASAETCEKVPAGRFSASGSDRNAHIHLAHSCSQNMNCTVAHIFRFKPTCRPSDKSENRPGGSHFVWVQPEQTFDRIARAAVFCIGTARTGLRSYRSSGMVFLNL